MTRPQRHIDWNLLRIFYFLCQSPTLSKAAKHLHVTQSCLSRRLADLEFNLGYRVFHRGPRGLTLLQEGKELLELVTPVFHKFTQYQASRTQQSQIAHGVLKVSIAAHLPLSWLMHTTNQFLDDHPEVSFHLLHHLRLSDDFAKYADCALQLFDAARAHELIQQPLCRITYGLYASQTYLDKNTPLEELEDLRHHPKLMLKALDDDTPIGWPKSVDRDSTSARLHEFSTAQDLLEATRQGLGIAALPKSQADLYLDLVALPFDLKDQEIQLYYAYPKYYQDLKRVTLYGEFLRQHFKNDIGPIPKYGVPIHDLILATG